MEDPVTIFVVIECIEKTISKRSFLYPILCFYYIQVKPIINYRAGLVNVTIPLEMCLYLLKEKDYVPWAMALEHLQKWKDILQETSLIPDLNYLLRHILSPRYNQVISSPSILFRLFCVISRIFFVLYSWVGKMKELIMRGCYEI